MCKRFWPGQTWCWCGLAMSLLVLWPTVASAVIVNPVTEHEYQLTVQNPFDQKFEDDTTFGFGTYMHTETLLGAGQASTGEQDVTIAPNFFSADLTSTVETPGSISSTTAEMDFTLDEAATVSFSGSGSGATIVLWSRGPLQLQLFADHGNWSTVTPLTLEPGPYRFKATASISNQATGTNSNNVVATFSPADGSPTGDYDGSGTVDENDYTLWKQQFGTTGPAMADGNGDEIVNAADFALWRDNLGATSIPGTGSLTAVPEPVTAVGAILFVVVAGFARIHNLA